MSYSSNVKLEITKKLPITELECLAELFAIFESKKAILSNSIEIRIENSIFAKRVYSLLKNISDLKIGVKYSTSKKFVEHNVYTIMVYKQKGILDFIEKFKFNYLDLIQNEEIFKGYMRGIFISCGYIKDPKKEYSLDFFIDNEELADKVYNMLIFKKKEGIKN